MWSIRI